MIRLALYSSQQTTLQLFSAAAGDEFLLETCPLHDQAVPDHNVPGVLALDLSNYREKIDVRDTLERFSMHSPSCRILFLIPSKTLVPEPRVLERWHAEPLLPPFDQRAIHLALSRLALELGNGGEDPVTMAATSDSAIMREVHRKVRMVAPTRTTVLLTGETGTGKSRLAKLIHQYSTRAHRQFIRVHCGALPESLIESELFGHEKGAFTGALRTRKGKFELADGGTIFLDEIGTITPLAQIKLLHVLQEKMVERVGGERLIPCDARIIAATNENPTTLCEQGKFRWDLFYRLNVFPIEVPPLRDRVENIIPLAMSFIRRFCHSAGKNIVSIHPRAEEALSRYLWPGNVRELENIIERACILEESPQIQPESLPLELLTLHPNTCGCEHGGDALQPLHAARSAAVEEFERRYLWALLHACSGSIKKSADAAGITTRQLHKLMVKHHLDKKTFRTTGTPFS